MEEQKHNILIVEDDDTLLEALTIQLGDSGFDVSIAKNGKEALKEAEAQVPDLILLDIIMPKVDGFEFLEARQKQEKISKVPVIVLTNLGQEDDRKKAMSLGATDYWVKAAFELEVITDKVKEILHVG